jgi:hypothetical protein
MQPPTLAPKSISADSQDDPWSDIVPDDDEGWRIAGMGEPGQSEAAPMHSYRPGDFRLDIHDMEAARLGIHEMETASKALNAEMAARQETRRAEDATFAKIGRLFCEVMVPAVKPEATAHERPFELDNSSNSGASTDQKHIRVLDAVGDPDGGIFSSSPKDRYSKLLKPLPLVGGGDPDAVWRTLEREFPWMSEANDTFAAAVAVSAAGRGYFRCPPMLLVGSPGVGKTRWTRRAAELANIPRQALSLAGARSSMSVAGSERGWSNARASFPAEAIQSLACANPLLVFDEVDKSADGGRNGDAVEATLPMLEKETAARYFDMFLLGNLNLSYVTWVLTANAIGAMPDTLLSRVKIVKVGRPDRRCLDTLIPSMLAEVAAELGVDVSSLPDPSTFMVSLAKIYEETASIRAVRARMEEMSQCHMWTPPSRRLRLV